MSALFEFGAHAPYIAAAYGASTLAIVAIIYLRARRLMKALERERTETKNA